MIKVKTYGLLLLLVRGWLVVTWARVRWRYHTCRRVLWWVLSCTRWWILSCIRWWICTRRWILFLWRWVLSLWWWILFLWWWWILSLWRRIRIYQKNTTLLFKITLQLSTGFDRYSNCTRVDSTIITWLHAMVFITLMWKINAVTTPMQQLLNTLKTILIHITLIFIVTQIKCSDSTKGHD